MKNNIIISTLVCGISRHFKSDFIPLIFQQVSRLTKLKSHLCALLTELKTHLIGEPLWYSTVENTMILTLFIRPDTDIKQRSYENCDSLSNTAFTATQVLNSLWFSVLNTQRTILMYRIKEVFSF